VINPLSSEIILFKDDVLAEAKELSIKL